MRFVDLAGPPRGGAPLLLFIALGILGAAGDGAAGRVSGTATFGAATSEQAPPHASRELTLDSFRTPDAPCYDRSVRPHTAVVDTHVHFRPFGGPAVPFEEILGVLRGDRGLVRQRLRHRPDAASVVLLHVLPGLSRHAGDADAEERLRQRGQRCHEDSGGTSPDAGDDVPRPGGPRVDSGRDGASGRRVSRPLPLDGRGQPGQAGAVRQRARGRTGSHDRGVGRLHGAAARTRHPARHPRGPGQRRGANAVPPVDGRGAAPVSGKRDRLGPHGAVAGVDRHGPGPPRCPDDVDAGPPSES